MAQAKIGRVYKTWALVVDEQELRRICDEMEVALRKTGAGDVQFTFEVRLSDQFSFETSSLDDLLKEENPRSRAINGLQIRAEGSKNSITLRLGLLPAEASRIDVEGEDRQWVYVTLSVLEDRLKRMAQWHPGNPFPGLSAGIIGLILATSMWILAIQKHRPILLYVNAEGKTVPTGFGLVILLALGILLVAAPAFVTAKLFPDLSFRIGDGIRRHDNRIALRSRLLWFLLGTVGLSILVRFATTLLW